MALLDEGVILTGRVVFVADGSGATRGSGVCGPREDLDEAERATVPW